MTDLDLSEILDRHQRAVEHVARVTEAPAGEWRVVLGDSESPDVIVPVCRDPRHTEFAAEADVEPGAHFDEECCPYYDIETRHERVAAFLAAAFTDVPALVAEVERQTGRADRWIATNERAVNELRSQVEAYSHGMHEMNAAIGNIIGRCQYSLASGEPLDPQAVLDICAGVDRMHASDVERRVKSLTAEVERLRTLLNEALDEIDEVAGARFLTDQYRARLDGDETGGAK